MPDDKCIMPECPYCPACPHGSVIYAEWVETRDDLSIPGAIDWYCDLIGPKV